MQVYAGMPADNVKVAGLPNPQPTDGCEQQTAMLVCVCGRQKKWKEKQSGANGEH